MKSQRLLEDFLADKELYDRHLSSLLPDELDALAKFVAEQFMNGALSWDTCSGLMNRTMAHYGFEKSPKFFWEIYLAFEDAETIVNQDETTRNLLVKILR